MPIIKQLCLCIPLLISIQNQYSMHTSNSDNNLFKAGRYHALELQDEQKFLLTAQPTIRHYTEQPISEETIQLMTNFLSLPNELRAYIFDFLEGHCLAYFARLNCMSKKSRKLAYKKLEEPHITSMLSRYARNKDQQTLASLYNEALHFDPRNRHPFTDLKNMHGLIGWFSMDKEDFEKHLSHYVTIDSSNTDSKDSSKTDPKDSSKTDPKFYELKREFLKILLKKIQKLIFVADMSGECVILSRYTPGAELCCLGTLYLLPGASASISLGLLSFLGCFAWTCSCYATNICCNCPEEKLLDDCINHTPCPNAGNLLCCRPHGRKKHPSFPCSVPLRLSKLTELRKIKKIIKTAQRILQSHADSLEIARLLPTTDLETEEKI